MSHYHTYTCTWLSLCSVLSSSAALNHTQSNLFMHVTAPWALTEWPFALAAVVAAVHMFFHISGNRQTVCSGPVIWSLDQWVIMSRGWSSWRGAGGWWQQKQHRAKQPALPKCFRMWFYYITELAHGNSTTGSVQQIKTHSQASKSSIQSHHLWISR